MKLKKMIIVLITMFIIIGIIVGITIVKNNAKSNTNQDQTEEKIETENTEEKSNAQFHVLEDINKDGKVEGITDLKWNLAHIEETQDKLKLSIFLNNYSEKDIEKQDVTIKVFDKQGKEILSKKQTMDKIVVNGSSVLSIENEIQDIVLIGDVQVFSK